MYIPTLCCLEKKCLCYTVSWKGSRQIYAQRVSQTKMLRPRAALNNPCLLMGAWPSFHSNWGDCLLRKNDIITRVSRRADDEEEERRTGLRLQQASACLYFLCHSFEFKFKKHFIKMCDTVLCDRLTHCTKVQWKICIFTSQQTGVIVLLLPPSEPWNYCYYSTSVFKMFVCIYVSNTLADVRFSGGITAFSYRLWFR